jgi:hypothetical protein
MTGLRGRTVSKMVPHGLPWMPVLRLVLGYAEGCERHHDEQHNQDNRELEKPPLDSPAGPVYRVLLSEDSAQTPTPDLEHDNEDKRCGKDDLTDLKEECHLILPLASFSEVR